ncbi:unnamed protein product [Darwinula stevensoni]|uniref:Rieske domain-containing protein n=1 Tax=Darwinula stevensoni TaxID=69355 RepID=A0A7R9A9B1_9CRUS|nr:unnamed protein product [Darwinula stevensoni]CAG0897225.1 unnamed protein product [Darwinula stevensoni]
MNRPSVIQGLLQPTTMMSYMAKSANLACALKATSQAVPSTLKPVIAPVVLAAETIIVPPKPVKLTSDSLNTSLPTGVLRATSGLCTSQQIRMAHTDIKVPDFSEYRHRSLRDNKASNRDSADSRRAFTYITTGAFAVGSAYVAKSAVTQFVMTMSASADVMALAKIEIKLSDIPEGKNVVFQWRGKPLFVRHRTPEEIKTEQSVDLASLRDPQADSDRTKDPKWLILLGVCTHLGCVPIANVGEFGGYYCPCHGSHYDASGRIRKGPAPLNLEVPQHEFMEGGILVVG